MVHSSTFFRVASGLIQIYEFMCVFLYESIGMPIKCFHRYLLQMLKIYLDSIWDAINSVIQNPFTKFIPLNEKVNVKLLD